MYLREKPNVLVIGCGVSGLTTADLLLDAGYDVEIWGQTETLSTTSSVAAAFWFPYQVFPRERVSVWARESYRTFSKLADLRGTAVLRRSIHELVASAQTPALVDLDPDWVGQLPAFSQLDGPQLPSNYCRGY
ncbi:MAG: FAD-dependent oxidoreductase, partial [Nannocystaceae bacterium]